MSSLNYESFTVVSNVISALGVPCVCAMSKNFYLTSPKSSLAFALSNFLHSTRFFVVVFDSVSWSIGFALAKVTAFPDSLWRSFCTIIVFLSAMLVLVFFCYLFSSTKPHFSKSNNFQGESRFYLTISSMLYCI